MTHPNALLAPFWRQQWRPVLASVGAGFANSLLTLLLPLSLGRFYEQFFGGSSNRGQALNTLGLNLLSSTSWPTYFGVFAGLILLRGLTQYAEHRLTGQLGETFVRYVRERTFAHHLALPTATHRQKPVGKYLLRFGSDFGSLRRYLTKGLVGFSRDVLFLLLGTAILLWLNPWLTALVAASLLPFLGLFRWINNRLAPQTIARRDQRSSYLNHVTTRLMAFETIKVFNRESVEREQFTKRSAALSTANADALVWHSGLAALLPVSVYAMLLTVLVGVHVWLPNGVSRANGGVLITFILLVLSLRPVLRRLLRVGTVWRSGWLSLQKLTAFLALPTESAAGGQELVVTQGQLTFESVSVAYHPGQPVLHRLSFSVPGGSVAQLTGGPGAGKTTVLNLLVGLRTPDSGTIWIDGQRLADCDPASIRRQVTLVSADVPLLGRTVFEAISYSRKPDKRPRAEALLNELQTLAHLTHRLTLDDVIGEQGLRLSTGQRSVLRLARALLTRKPVLLLDEPFAGLTDAAVWQLMQWLTNRNHNQTLLLVGNNPLPFIHSFIHLQPETSSPDPCPPALIMMP